MPKKLISNFLVFIAMLVTLISCSGKTTITEEDVKALYDAIDKAVIAKDTETVLDLMSDDITINMKVLSPDSNQNMDMGKEEYAKSLRDTFSVMQDYEYRVDEMSIDISADGKSAEVKRKVYEKITAQGNTIKSVTKDNTKLELRNGKILAVDIKGVMILQ